MGGYQYCYRCAWKYWYKCSFVVSLLTFSWAVLEWSFRSSHSMTVCIARHDRNLLYNDCFDELKASECVLSDITVTFVRMIDSFHECYLTIKRQSNIYKQNWSMFITIVNYWKSISLVSSNKHDLGKCQVTCEECHYLHHRWVSLP